MIELIVASVSATLLMAGLASCLYISVQAFEGGATTLQRTQTAQGQADFLIDLQEATSFIERTGTSVHFEVPDRDNDGVREQIHYTYSGGVLNLSYNGSAATPVLKNIEGFSLAYTTRSISSGTLGPAAYDENEWGNRWLADEEISGVAFRSFSEAKLDSNGTELNISLPAGVEGGDLLIVAVATDGENKTDLGPVLPGWTLIELEAHNTNVTLGVWWKLADVSEPALHTFRWGASEKAYGWMMRFTGHDPATPVEDFAGDSSGRNYNPPSPGLSTSVNESMVVRIGGFDDDDISVDNAGVTGYTTITMDQCGSGSGTVSGGAAYARIATPTSVPEMSFSLTSNEQSVTLTLVIPPAPVAP